MKVNFKLTTELIQGLKKGYIKASDLVNYLLSFDNVTTNKTENIAIKDLVINNKEVVNALINPTTEEIEIELGSEVITTVSNKEEKKTINKSYKFSNKDIIVIHNLLNDITSGFIKVNSAFKELESYCKNKNKLEVFKKVITHYSDKDFYHSGSLIDFKNGTKVYYDINDYNAAYEKALKDDFIDNKESIKIKPYYPLNFNNSKTLINSYLIELGQKVA